ncbi:MAG: Na/Pi cotransporter family protein [Thomasclavelia ramosa]
MDFITKNIIGFIASLGVFLYSMHLMSTSLDTLANDKLENILYKLSSNKYLGVITGTAITAIIHSSSATTIILIGLLNSHLISLNQATWIILGANIGTTVTGLMIALDLGQSAIYLCVLGLLLMFLKNKIAYLGRVLMALGLIFSNGQYGCSLAPLQTSPYFINMFGHLDNPLTAILVGTIFTALIQSSTASVGVLQTIYQKGLISFAMATNVIYGQNIGTCITAVLASLNGDRSSKRLSAIHILINVLGTIIFVILAKFIPLVSFIESLTPNYMMQIAYMHTFFNIISTIILLPFDNLLILSG